MDTPNNDHEPTTPVQSNPYLMHESSIPPPPPPEYYMHQKTGKVWKVAIPVVLLLLGVAVGILAYPVIGALYHPAVDASPTPFVPFANPASQTHTPTPRPSSIRQAPLQVSPVDGSTFSNYPRTTTLQWQPLPGYNDYIHRITYTIDIEYWLPSIDPSIPSKWTTMETVSNLDMQQSAFTFDFIGAQQGRWRVWAVDSRGIPGPKSSWWTFTYTV
jgi:hypothetical protein